MSDYAELVKRLEERRITGMNATNAPDDWSLHLSETTDPLCVEAADAIKALVQERDALRAQVNGWQRMMDEALNTGDGSYRP